MILKVIVNFPDDMEGLRNRASELLAKIIINKYSYYQVNQLIEAWKNDVDY